MVDAKLRILLVVAAASFGCRDDGGADGPGTTPTGTTTAGATTTHATGPTGTTDLTSTTAGICQDEQPAVVTDIDATLTLSDGEFIMQLMDGSYDPAQRDGAADLMQAYASRGYHVLYLTARSELITIQSTGETAREITMRWLEEHGFPTDPSGTTLTLAPMLLLGDAIQEYKAGALMEGQAMGWRFDYAYGNAPTDIGAYADAGIALEQTFIIGEEAGAEGTVAIEGEGWQEHSNAHLPSVPVVCE